MGRLTCACLNVSVHFKGASWRERALEGSVLLPHSDPLAGGMVFEVELDVAGATAEHRVLVGVRSAGDWLVHSCNNCNTDCYILHSVKERAGRSFVTGMLLGAEEGVAVQGQSGYSHVFRMVLYDRPDDDEMMSRKRISSMSFGREDPLLKTLHSQMKAFLTVQQEAMEERISQFEEEQRRAFAELQQQTHRERALLFSAIGRARASVLSDAMKEQPSKRKAPPSPRHTHTTSTKHPSTKPHPSPPDEEQRKVTVTLTNPTFPNKPIPVKAPPTSGTDDTVFSLDGFDEERAYEEPDVGVAGGVAFPQSDDEEISTDDSSYRDVSALQGIASSVPVTVPMFSRREGSSNTGNFSSDGFQLQDVGNSIKALALSVQDTGMFGDLPRPRIRSYNRFH